MEDRNTSRETCNSVPLVDSKYALHKILKGNDKAKNSFSVQESCTLQMGQIFYSL